MIVEGDQLSFAPLTIACIVKRLPCRVRLGRQKASDPVPQPLCIGIVNEGVALGLQTGSVEFETVRKTHELPIEKRCGSHVIQQASFDGYGVWQRSCLGAADQPIELRLP